MKKEKMEILEEKNLIWLAGQDCAGSVLSIHFCTRIQTVIESIALSRYNEELLVVRKELEKAKELVNTVLKEREGKKGALKKCICPSHAWPKLGTQKKEGEREIFKQ